jgi:mannitol/fructose-specific phosphotransferase system IIA component (Ntr-type)
MKLTEILKKECVRVTLRASEKKAVITELVDLLDEVGQLADRDDVLRAVLAREETRSTGIGLGLAVPHGKSHGCETLVMAVGKPDTPMEFESIDGRPCNLIILLTSPVDKTGPHIQALASISRLWQNETFRKTVTEASTADELYAAIERYQG